MMDCISCELSASRWIIYISMKFKKDISKSKTATVVIGVLRVQINPDEMILTLTLLAVTGQLRSQIAKSYAYQGGGGGGGGGLLEQAVILFNCVPFQNRTFS